MIIEGGIERDPYEGRRLALAFRNIPAALRSYSRYRNTLSLCIYYSPLWCPYVFATVRLGTKPVESWRSILVGVLLLSFMAVTDFVDQLVDIEEDRELHPERTASFVASRPAPELLTVLLLVTITTIAIVLGAAAAWSCLAFATVFALLFVTEPLVGKFTIRLVGSVLFGTVPVLAAIGLDAGVPVWRGVLLTILLATAQMSYSWFDDAGDRVKAGREAGARRRLVASAGAFGICVASGVWLLVDVAGTTGLAWAVVPVVLSLPFATTLLGPHRLDRARHLRIEPSLELRWADGRSRALPVWLGPMGFPPHVLVVAWILAP